MSACSPNVRPEFQQAYDRWKEVEDICRTGKETPAQLDESGVLYEALKAMPARSSTEIAMKLHAARIFSADNDTPDEELEAIEAELRTVDNPDLAEGNQSWAEENRAWFAERQRAWVEAFVHYQRLHAESDVIPLAAEGEDEAVNAYCEAQDALFDTPAPTMCALAQKLKIMRERYEEYGAFPTDVLDALADDIRSLGCREGA